jgi:hypothetical protein
MSEQTARPGSNRHKLGVGRSREVRRSGAMYLIRDLARGRVTAFQPGHKSLEKGTNGFCFLPAE